MIDDITTAIKAQLYDRITSPLSGAFALSWCVWNWKFITILLSDIKAPLKLTYIELEIFPTVLSGVLHGLVFPLATAILIITVYPIPARWFYRISQKHKVTLKNVQVAIEDETPLTIQEAADLRKSYRSIQAQHEHDLSGKTIELGESKKRIQELESSNKALGDRLQDVLSELENTNTELIQSKNTTQEILNSNNRLSALASSMVPSIAFSDTHMKLVRIPSAITEDEHINLSLPPASAIEDSIQKNLTHYIARNGILMGHTPSIYVAGGIVYLHTKNISMLSCVLGNYGPSYSNVNLDNLYKILSHLHKDGFPAK